ncbi:MAG TPA: DUF3352 domain-containing protein [Oscillatoriales cyanobacterium M59_W2019_021]|nr:DUF3352 domain-containing protein [Oscillatoriales cyanobacterium M4454_W2019_049]HIK51297.1 DUF3352 domain-containing protein [Oscillatoriales cyanobacterium M59_W2019_021]
MSTTPKKSRLGLLSLAGIAAVAIASAAWAYIYLRGAPTGNRGALAAARLVPESAWGTVYFSTDRASWSRLEEFGTTEAQTVVKSQLDRLGQEILDRTGVDPFKDVRPWVGGVTIARLPGDATDGIADRSDLLIVLGIRDKLKAMAFAKKMKANAQGQIAEQEYQGVTLTEVAQKDGTTLGMAILGNHWVLAFDPELVRQAIDTYKGSPSFASQPDIENLLERGTGVDTPLAQAYIADYQPLLESAAAEGDREISPSAVSELESVNSIALGVGVGDRGLQAKAIADLDPEVTFAEAVSPNRQIATRFPAETLVAIGGRSPHRVWMQLVARSQTQPQVGEWVDRVRSGFKQIQLEADGVFRWMDGDFALGLIPSQEGILAQTGFGGALVLQTSDRAAAAATLKQLNEVVRTRLPLPLTVKETEVQGIALSEWSIPQIAPGALVSYGWLDDRSLLIAFGSPLVNVMVPQPATNLSQSETFRDAVESLPQTNFGSVYVNMEQTLSILNRLPPEATPISPEANVLLQSVRGIGITATPPKNNASTVEIAIPLKRRSQ